MKITKKDRQHIEISKNMNFLGLYFAKLCPKHIKSIGKNNG
jgi:hypothetical protein